MSSRRVQQIQVKIPCEGCAEIEVSEPGHNGLVPGLQVPLLAGRAEPSPSRALWRVHSSAGDVMDGTLSVDGQGRFALERVPLFAGPNQLQVVVTGVGAGQGEARCSTTVVSSIAQERGIRAIMVWDGETSDLDLHLIGPGAVFGDVGRTLSARSRSSIFGGEVEDDFDGFGPEMLRLERVEDGVYGIVVEPVTDAEEPGSNVFVWLLVDGRMLTSGPVGPRYLSARRGELWVLGTVAVRNGRAELLEVDEVVSLSSPPTQPPSMWPTLY